MRSCVTLEFDFNGLHYWSQAPMECFWLKQPHMHKFKVQATVEVGHSDREVEFITKSNWLYEAYCSTLEMWMDTGVLLLKERSCEVIAAEVFGICVENGLKPIQVRVSEDGNWSGQVDAV